MFIFGFCDYRYSSTSSIPLKLNLPLGVYHYCRSPTCLKNHVPDDLEIYQMLGILIQNYAPDFTDRISPAGNDINHPAREVLWPTAQKFGYVLCGSQFRGHISEIFPRFYQLGFIFV